MMNSVLTAAGTTLLMFAGSAAISTADMTAQAADCLSRRDAQEATLGGQILQLQDIYAQNGLKRKDVVDRKVCRRDGELYYVLSIYANGEARTLWINARTGASSG